MKAEFDGLKTNLMIDITTGDVITYKEVEFKYNTLFDNEVINIMTYNYETIIAEKFDSVISRNVDNTRMKDYYDLYMFVNLKWNDIIKDKNHMDKEIYSKALKEYARSENKDILRLVKYAKKLDIEDEVVELMDVLL